jgi:multiple sugar transport system substrate-binding protein
MLKTRVLSLFLLVLLAACIPLVPVENESTPATTQSSIPENELTEQLPKPSATPSITAGELVIWLPALFAEDGSEGWAVLEEYIKSFEEQNPGCTVIVRQKDSVVKNSLVNSLALASAVAPNSVPSLALLNRHDLEIAAAQGLVSPLAKDTMQADTDWYEYARSLALYQDQLFGLPIAGDSLVLVYNSQLVTADQASSIDSWNTLLSLEKPVAFNSADSQARFPLTVYLSAGGIVQDEDQQPALSIPVLTEVYRIFAQGKFNGVFPAWTAEVQNDEEAWLRLRYGEADFLVTTVSSYMENRSADFLAVPLPALSTGNYALADGWMWAVTDLDPQRRETAEKLAVFLSSTEFLAEWTQAAGFLPVRPSAMVSWSTQSVKTFFGKVILSLQQMPPADVQDILSVPLYEGALKVIESGEDAYRAADWASRELQPEK